MSEPQTVERATRTDSHAIFLYYIKARIRGVNRALINPFMKTNKNEELQSRRQFFKRAAKTALPILGAIVLANMPIIAKATETETGCSGCGSSCSGSCKYTCSGSCKNGCEGCKYTCSGSCKNSCSGTCKYSSSR